MWAAAPGTKSDVPMVGGGFEFMLGGWGVGGLGDTMPIPMPGESGFFDASV
jgi:hypothetical protein